MRVSRKIALWVLPTLSMAGAAVEDLDAPPVLPDIDNLLKEASDTVAMFSSQATRVQELVSAQQDASKQELATQKERFERELANMKQNNSDMVIMNDKIRLGIAHLKEGNEALLKEAEKLGRGSNLMRDALIALEPKMAVAKSFLTDSLNRTNLTGHKALKVLDPPAPEPTLEHFLSVARGTLDSTSKMLHKSEVAEQMSSERVSLLEMSGGMKVNRRQQPAAVQQQKQGSSNTAEELVQTLANSIASLDAAEVQGGTQLQAHFIALSEVRTKRYEVLAAEQQVLNQTRANMVMLQDQLHTAKSHLYKTIEDLKQRINGIRLFAQTANKTVVAAMQQARLVHPSNITAVGATALLTTLNAFPVKLPSLNSPVHRMEI